MNRLIPWGLPFITDVFPSVGMYVEHGDEEADLVCAIIAPDGIDKYPKYIVQFGEVLEFSCYEEGCSPVKEYDSLLGDMKGVNPLEWLGSPSIESYKGFVGVNEKLRHFIILGADNNLEVVTSNEPKISKIDSPKKINIELNV